MYVTKAFYREWCYTNVDKNIALNFKSMQRAVRKNSTTETLLKVSCVFVFQWSTPSEVLQSYQAQEFWIAPPQFYELSRLCRIPLLNDLHDFSRKRGTEGIEHWLPVHFMKDGRFIALMPGATY